MKKFPIMRSAIALITAGLLILTGCSDTDTGGSMETGTPQGKSVLGQVNGVVYDSITLTPVQDVEVQVGSIRTTTGRTGAFLLNDVGVGEQTVSFFKSGYRFTSRNVTVNPGQYKTDDPFGEYEALQDQMEALKEWAEKNIIPGYESGQSNLTWTYQDGVWINGDGTAVTVNNENGQFAVTNIKLDYVYSYAIPLYVIDLVPLNGALTGQIKLVKATNAQALNIQLGDNDIVNVDAGIDLWFTDTASHLVGNNGEPVNGQAQYGPFKTKANGVFEAAGVPAKVDLSLVINGFSKDGYFYNANSADKVKSWNNTSFYSASIQANPHDNGYTNVGTVYLFAEEDFVTVSEAAAGTVDAPIQPNGSVVLSFSDDINPAGFTASLTTTANARSGAATIPLTPSWINARTVSLKAANGFPYCDNGSVLVGRLNVSGTARNGAAIYADNSDTADAGLPVFTAEGLKLDSMDIAPVESEIPSRMVVSAKAVKLTFNRAISKTSQFTWSSSGSSITNGGPADWCFAANGENAVYIYTDVLTYNPSTGSPNNLYLWYSAISAVDPNDDTGANKVVGGSTPTVFNKALMEQKLALVKTNIYDNKTNLNPIEYTASEANFKAGTTGQTSAITLEFNNAIPNDAFVQVGLTKNSVPAGINDAVNNSVSLTITGKGTKILTITPNVRLSYAANYHLAVEIKSKDGEELFGGGSLPLYNGKILATSGAYHTIHFFTESDPASSDFASIVYGRGTSAELIASPSAFYRPAVVRKGTAYYVQFDKPISLITENYEAGINIIITVQKLGTDVLSFTVSGTGTGQATLSLGGIPTAPKINTSTGNFTINLDVQ